MTARSEIKSSKKKSPAKKRAGSEEINSPILKTVHGRTEILVLGTAHVSRQSVTDVEDFFKSFKPDAVCVELCQSRHDAMRDPDRWRKLDMAKVIRENKIGLLVSSLILSAFQKKIGESSGVKPGEEMIRACELTDSHGKKLVLADREVRITLSRAWGRVGFFSKLWLASELFASLLVQEEVDADQIEKMKQEDVLEDLFSKLPPRYATIREVIIDERDKFLAQKIKNTARELEAANGKKTHRIFAVVGAGHLAGIEKNLIQQEDTNLDHLHVVPPKRRFRTIFSWLSFSAILGVFFYAFQEGSGKASEALIAWALCRSVPTMLGALIARAHPLTVLVTTLIAPFSVFILGTRLWMFSALTELWLKKPRVEDFENIASDTDSLRGLLRSFYSNRVLKLIWIILLVSTGLTIGNVFFLKFVITGVFKIM